MPPEIHPAITKKIEALLDKARDLASSQQQNLDILLKTIDLKDAYGLKMRTQEVAEVSAKLQWISAQVTALRELPYEMVVSDPKRRISTTSMQAVRDDKKEPE